MGCRWLSFAWLQSACVVAGCSAGVIDGAGATAFGSATAATSGAATTVGGETSGSGGEGETQSEADAEGEAEGSPGSQADSSAGSASESASDEGTTGAMGVCGNDVLESDEVCDGLELGDASCADYGFEDGVLACDPACSHITEACFTCGDGEIGLGEACDGSEFGGDTCDSLGFGGGALSCSADCMEVDDSGCVPLPSCGDGLLNGGEQCDGGLLGGANCVSQGFDLGNLACQGNCTYDTSGCMDDLDGCGQMGDFCIFDENDLQSTCCPAGVGGNMFGICNVFVCV